MKQQSYESLAYAIVRYQEAIIGPLARTEADNVSGLDFVENNAKITGDATKVLDALVKRYEGLFGKASIEACKDAIRPLLGSETKIDLPDILK